MVNYVAQILIAVAISAVLAGSLNLILGYTGLFSVAHAAFFGIGAYAAAQVILLLKAPFPLDLLAAFLAAAVIAALLGPPIARLKEEYVIVGTLALQLVLSNVFLNWQPVTGGSYGIFGIPRPALFGYPLTALVDYALFVLAIAALCFLVLWWLVRSPYGLVLKALREDPLLAQSLGKNVNRQRAIAFALGSGVAGIAGMLYARYVGYIDPSTFGIGQSLSITTILVVGGLGNLWGTLLGAAILETVPQVLRFIPAFSQAVAHLQLIFFGLLLVALVRLRPQGLISERPLVRAGAARQAADAPPADRAAPSQPPAPDAALAARPPAGQAAPLAVQHVSKSFGGLRAVVDLSLRVEPGRVTAIIGPNGAGKTTLFNILSGYLHPDHGEIRYGDHDLTRLRPFEIARLGIARSFQDVRVFSRMTVLENVVLTMQGHAVERLASVFSPSRWALREQERARLRALELLGSFGLLPFADERVANLSYAQQKLLVVVTLVARDDPLILLDELAAGLDHDSVAAFSRLVREMAAGGRTVCLIEHNLDFVWQTADTVLVLDQGQLIAEGSPEQIQRDQHVAEIYFGSARAVDA